MKLEEHIISLVNEKSKEKDVYAIDPATLLILVKVAIEIILFILDMYNNDTEKSIQATKNLGFFRRFILRRLVYNKIDDKVRARNCYDILLSLSKDMDDNERKLLFMKG